jgi:glycosyltransferase involved in cell wall biosynthesis
MNILIAHRGIIPVTNYGGTERVIWYLGKELSKLGHAVSYLVNKGSHCDFAKVIFIDPSKNLATQIPEEIDIVHFNFFPSELIAKPYVITMHGNVNDKRKFDLNTIFVSENHAARFGSKAFVHNGLDWNDYQKPSLNNTRSYYHFLGNAAWRVKNVRGAIHIIHQTKEETLKVLGGTRLNFNMGFRFTASPRIRFYGMVGGTKKFSLINSSKGLIFPVRWHEPFGLAITESLFFGCPVFGTPYGSLPEIVNEDVGFLSANISELTEALENKNNFSANVCHEYALDNFNSKKMALQYVEKYMTVLKGRTLNKINPSLLQVQTEKFLPFK